MCSIRPSQLTYLLRNRHPSRLRAPHRVEETRCLCESHPLPFLPLTQPHLAQQSFGRGGIGNIRRSSPPRRVRPTHTHGREPEVGVPSLRIPRPYTDIPRSGLFCRMRWCRKHSLLVSRCPQGRPANHQGRNRGRVRGHGCPKTRRGNHHRKHSSTLQTHPLKPSSI
jgi:hypothetical protein